MGTSNFGQSILIQLPFRTGKLTIQPKRPLRATFTVRLMGQRSEMNVCTRAAAEGSSQQLIPFAPAPANLVAMLLFCCIAHRRKRGVNTGNGQRAEVFESERISPPRGGGGLSALAKANVLSPFCCLLFWPGFSARHASGGPEEALNHKRVYH